QCHRARCRTLRFGGDARQGEVGMYKSIVVGTDGSETATIAVNHAIEMARTTGATLHIVNAHHALSAGIASLSTEAGGPAFDTTEVNRSIALESERICESSLQAA